MARNMTAKIVLGFIMLIVGVSLITPIATNTEGVTEYSGVSNETIDIASARLGTGNCPMSMDPTVALSIANLPTGWKASDVCPVTSFTMNNQTGDLAIVTTDYTFFGINGSVYLKNTTRFVGDACDQVINDTFVTYLYCGDDYVKEAWQRTILELIAGFVALAILAASLAIFYSVAKDAGIVKG